MYEFYCPTGCILAGRAAWGSSGFVGSKKFVAGAAGLDVVIRVEMSMLLLPLCDFMTNPDYNQ